ncbi:MAG: aldo/keto reductase [Bacteroidota bacterium]
MKSLSFTNGDTMPILGLGTWKSASEHVYDAVRTAIQAGYRHIDCAMIYGNESAVGRAVNDAIAAGEVTREDLWITSKLWNNSHAEEQVVPALQKTLSDLKLDYLDLYLIHWPVAVRHEVLGAQEATDYIALADLPITTTWRGMEQAQQQGLARHIGVSNFAKHHLEEILREASIPPAMNQIELHPYLQQKELVDYCQERQIHLTAYSPLGSGDRPANLKGENEPSLLGNETIKAIAATKNASPAQVLIAWSIHRNVSVIPKSTNPGRIRENFAAAELALSAEELEQIAQLDLHRRYVDGSFWEIEGGPYTVAELWGA